MNYVDCFILSIIEVCTEYIPVSSTAHMIIFYYLYGITIDNNFTRLLITSIQLPPIISILFIYRRFVFSKNFFWKKIFIGSLPIIILGGVIHLLRNNTFPNNNIMIISISLLIGGLILIKINKYYNQSKYKYKNITYFKAFNIGLFQCLAIVPGISRSGSSIVGGILQKLDKNIAIMFSFLLALPTTILAIMKILYDLYNKNYILNNSQIKLLIFANISTCIISLICINFFIRVIQKNNIFKWIGYYRLILGSSLLIMLYYTSFS